MAKILNKFMEYIGFGKDDVEYDEEPEDGLRETETVPEERKKSTERRVLSTEVETAQRILDFMSGACYAVDGRLYKVSARIFLVAPANYDIIGSSDGFRE